MARRTFFRWWLVVGAVFATALWSCASAPPPAPPCVSTVGDHLGGMRSLLDLDRNCDNALDESDAKIFSDALGRWQPEVERRQLKVAADQIIYEGPHPQTAGHLAHMLDPAQPVDVPWSDEELAAAWIELRWMHGQLLQASVMPPKTLGREFSGVLSGLWAGYSPQQVDPSALCDVVGSAVVDSVKLSGSTPTMITDLDSTVWSGNVMDGFLAVLVEDKLILDEANPGLQEFLLKQQGVAKKRIKRGNAVQNAEYLLERWMDQSLPKEQRLSAGDVFFQIVAMLKGLSPQKVQTAARKVFEKGSKRFPPWTQRTFADGACGMADMIATAGRYGVKVYALSATLDVLAVEGARQFGIPPERVVGSRLEVAHDKYTGQVVSTYTIKGPVTRQLLEAPPLFALGDSPSSDFDMLLEASVAGIMVNPRASLLEKDEAVAGGRMVGVSFGTVASGEKLAKDDG